MVNDEQFEVFKQEIERFENRKRNKDILVNYIGIPFLVIYTIFIAIYFYVKGISLFDPIPKKWIVPLIVPLTCLIISFIKQINDSCKSDVKYRNMMR